MDSKSLLTYLPYQNPFLFVDELVHVDESGAKGNFTFREDLDFYKGHFKGNPVTPGVILTECCAQIGLVCLGLFILKEEKINLEKVKIGLSSSQMEFLKPVFPREKVTVTSTKLYYRFNKLKCEVKMHNASGDLLCKGIIAGMVGIK
ncbi:3-hydroxyacyl-ACP dehydratase FabZ family protein [Maribacter aestuarii]|uniref:3-hydroxyacyl-ACP dehydratase FabZ family protein n=1 Tax=Maribacter aestuarii TaxID=1130723 RepID=UPI00248BC344|nr:FabA/FabZ family ACP-dehydratase [Maribacter aestuarii]